jgi:prolyl 4-hydroxylase
MEAVSQDTAVKLLEKPEPVPETLDHKEEPEEKETSVESVEDPSEINALAIREQLEDLPLALLPLNRPLSIRKVCEVHPIFVIDNFLSPDECQEIIRFGDPKLYRSTAVENNQLVIRDYRNSWTGFISPNGKFSENAAVNEVLRRVCCFSGYPVNHLESVNIVRYRANEKYEAHFDYFEPRDSGIMGKAGQRVMTFFVYLNDVPEECGGATYFTNLNLKIRPKQGSCAVWFNTNPTNEIRYSASHHGGETVRSTPNHPDPVKYALNIWVRQNCFCCGQPL